MGLAVSVVRLASAQPAPAPAAGDAVFLPRAGFSFTWGSLITTDSRFDWSGQVAFDLDIVDYGAGRLRFASAYEAILGRERRRYDLNQGHYSFEVSASRRIGSTEIVTLVRHASRHAVDRENQPSISWNVMGVAARRQWTFDRDRFAPGAGRRAGRTTITGTIDLGRAMQQATVDYLWVSNARAEVARSMTPRTALVVTASGAVVGVKRAIYSRERVCGGRLEGALRVRGQAAAVELFAGYERRIDAYPTDRFRVRWFTVGFRVASQ